MRPFISAILVLIQSIPVLGQIDSLVCDEPYIGAIADIGASAFVSFEVSENEIFSIMIQPTQPFGSDFKPYWRIIDRDGNPAASCGTFTLKSPADCGPLPVSGNPYRVEVSDFFSDDTGAFRLALQRLTWGYTCDENALTCDTPYVGAIDDSVDSDLLSFEVAENEIFSITVRAAPGAGPDFTPYWRIIDRDGHPAESCSLFTLKSPADCGPLPVSGNPYRIQVTDFFNDDTGGYRLHFQRLTYEYACDDIPLICDIPLTATIDDSVDSDLFSFDVPSEEMVKITITDHGVSDFEPYWRIIDRYGHPAATCDIRTLLREAECGPLPPSGNPYRIEVMDFFNNSSGPYGVQVNYESSLCAPRAPFLESPINRAVDVPVDIDLSWLMTDRAMEYGVQLASDSTFSTSMIIDRRNITETSLAPTDPLPHETVLFWRVNAANAAGTSGWSDVWRFTTVESPPAAPSLTEPRDDSTCVPEDPTLSWMVTERTRSYHVQVSADPEFSSLVRDNPGITGTSIALDRLANNTLYYWRVSSNNVGGSSGWSVVYRFTTGGPLPAAPVLLEPRNRAYGLTNGSVFKWQVADGALTYQIQIAADADFSSVDIDQKSITLPEYTAIGLDSLATYHWRVRAFNECRLPGSWSDTWTFSTPVVGRDMKETPEEYALEQNYPNPFNPTTIIGYALPKSVRVKLTIFNSLGETIDTLVDGTQAAGRYEIHWQPGDLTSGVYFYRIQTVDFCETKTMIFLR